MEYAKLKDLSNTKFKRCVGVSRFVFDFCVLVLKDYSAKTKIKQGRPSNLSTENQLLLLLQFYRENRTFFHLGVTFGLAESNAYRTILRVEDILIKCDFFRLSGKKGLLNEQAIRSIIVDVTETPALRPKKRRCNKRKVGRSSRQKRKYSGKKKRFTHKIQVVIDADTGRIVCVHVANGACHDFKLYKQTRLPLRPDITQQVDAAYKGAQKWHTNTQLPYKASKNHPLTKEQKKENRQLAQQRIKVEHTNCRLKVFNLLENRYRSHSRFGLRVTLIACFVNANQL